MFFIRSESVIVPDASAGTGPGVTPAPGGMSTLTVSCLVPAVVSTVTPFVINPALPARFTVTLMGPSAPAAMCHGWEGSWATVQPQDVRTPFTSTSAEETFVSQNVKCAAASPALALYSLTSASHLIAFGLGGVSLGVSAEMGRAASGGGDGAGAAVGERRGGGGGEGGWKRASGG